MTHHFKITHHTWGENINVHYGSLHVDTVHYRYTTICTYILFTYGHAKNHRIYNNAMKHDLQPECPIIQFCHLQWGTAIEISWFQDRFITSDCKCLSIHRTKIKSDKSLSETNEYTRNAIKCIHHLLGYLIGFLTFYKETTQNHWVKTFFTSISLKHIDI